MDSDEGEGKHGGGGVGKAECGQDGGKSGGRVEKGEGGWGKWREGGKSFFTSPEPSLFYGCLVT